MRRRSIAATAVISVLLAGCDFTFGENADDASASNSADEIATPVVTQPPSPFCVAVDELERRVDESTTDSDRAIIVEAYTEMLDLVPPEVRPDFEAVLAELRAGTATVPTTAPIASVDLDAPTGDDDTSGTTQTPGSTVAGTQVFEEGYTPQETPAARIGAYVDFACDRSENNPGPPPTQPSEPVPGTTSP